MILATSREGLGIEGERLVPMPSLGVPDADADLGTIREAEAVRLFAELAPVLGEPGAHQCVPGTQLLRCQRLKRRGIFSATAEQQHILHAITSTRSVEQHRC